MSLFSAFFAVVCATWLSLSVLRFLSMYRTGSPLQAWRRFDPLCLIPVGAFFSPGPPVVEIGLVVRSRSSDGTDTEWSLLPGSIARRWWHVVWNPGKVDYRTTVDVCRGLLSAASQMEARDAMAIPRLQLTDEYLAVLRLVSAEVARSSPNASAVQFAVLSHDLSTDAVRTALLSAAHTIPKRLP